MKRIPTRKVLVISIGIVIITVLLVFITSLRQSQRVKSTVAQVNHTETILHHIQKIIVASLDNETGARGYVITGQARFLEPLRMSEENLAHELQQLYQLVTDPRNLQWLDSARFYIGKRIAFSDSMVLVRREQGLAATVAMVEGGRGKQYTDHIRRIGNEMEQVENGLLARNKKRSDATIRELNAILYSVLALALLLSILIIRRIRKDIGRQQLNEQKFSALLNAAPDATVIVDQNGIIQLVNLQVEKLFGYAPGEITGRPVEVLIPAELRSRHVGHRDSYMKAARVRLVGEEIEELKAINKNGDIFPVEIVLSPIQTKEGLLVSASIRDITARKKVEAEIKKMNAELAQRVESRTTALEDSVKETEDYKYALDESSIVAITDQKGAITYVNDNFCKISKYSREELIGQDHSIINSGHHPKQLIHGLWVTIANGKIWRGELKNKAKDGTFYWVDTTIVPFLDKKDKPYQYIAIRADITERKEAEESLRRSLKETADYKYALDESSIVAITDQKGAITYVNDNFCKISKYSREELIGQDHRIINSGHHSQTFIRDLWVTIANGYIWRGELKNKAKDGTFYWVDTTIVPFLHETGKPYQYIAIRADITKRKETEESLIKSEKIYKAIASSIPGSVICLLDTEYRYLLIEGDMFEKLGYSKKVMMGNKAADVLPAEIFAELAKDFDKVLQGEIITRETCMAGYDIISRYIPLKDADNNVYAIMTAAIDITELKNAQRNVIELNRDLEAKIVTRTEELKKTNQELEAFSYSVSHDLRAPLRGIIAFTKILEEEYGSRLDDEAKRITSIIRDSALKMGNLIDDLLAFSRMGKQGIMKVEINTRQMVAEIAAELEKENNSTRIISWHIHDLLPVYADVNTIRQVWINLISNAIKYTGNSTEPRIEISSYAKADRVVFYVKDNGAGFDEAYKDKLFKVFQRLHDADEFEGTGIGLALVEKIISRHGGRVWAEGKENAGACFYFSLPIKNTGYES